MDLVMKEVHQLEVKINQREMLNISLKMPLNLWINYLTLELWCIIRKPLDTHVMEKLGSRACYMITSRSKPNEDLN